MIGIGLKSEWMLVEMSVLVSCELRWSGELIFMYGSTAVLDQTVDMLRPNNFDIGVAAPYQIQEYPGEHIAAANCPEIHHPEVANTRTVKEFSISSFSCQKRYLGSPSCPQSALSPAVR